jgi:hypothetical protein
LGLLGLLLEKGLCIGVRLGHNFFGSNLIQCVSIMCAYDGWACFIEMQVCYQKFYIQESKFLSLKFERTIKATCLYYLHEKLVLTYASSHVTKMLKF